MNKAKAKKLSMNYKKNPGILLNLDVENLSFKKGNLISLKKGNLTEYDTSLIFILPFKQKNYDEGNFQIEYQGNLINIHIYKIQEKSNDPISSLAKDVGFGSNENEIKLLPFEAISDNRGKYPCFCAEIIFPFRLADWINYDHEESAVTGPIKNKDKITALIVLNKLFSSVEYQPNIERLTYDDVTVFLENYIEKKNANIIFQKLNYFTSEKAYKNSVEYFLGWKISEIPIKKSTIEILNEEDLLKQILIAINEIKRYIENQYKIQPFWDGSRNITQNGNKIKVSANPKNETNIQPTLHLLLQILLSKLGGVHVVRETNEGVGILDFRCLYTTKENNAISISIEFKLAHNKKIRSGLTKQLPAYLRANQSNSGVFIVMWFKDEKGKHFKEPKNRTKSEMIKFLEETSKTIGQKEGLKIDTILIDASIQPSASKL